MDTVATEPVNVLIADDDKAVATTLSYIIRHLGYSADVVDDGGPALERIQRSPAYYQLLITDHAMQKMDGLELVEKLKLLHYPGKILVLSAYLDRKTEASYRFFGVENLMDKPFDPAVLRNKVKELIAQQATRSSPGPAGIFPPVLTTS